MENEPCRVEMSVPHLVTALNAITAAQKRGHLIVGYEDGALLLRRGPTAVRIPATGTWPLRARVHPSFLRDLKNRIKLLTDPVVLEGTRSMLHVSHYSIPCSWEPHPPQETERTVA